MKFSFHPFISKQAGPYEDGQAVTQRISKSNRILIIQCSNIILSVTESMVSKGVS